VNRIGIEFPRGPVESVVIRNNNRHMREIAEEFLLGLGKDSQITAVRPPHRRKFPAITRQAGDLSAMRSRLAATLRRTWTFVVAWTDHRSEREDDAGRCVALPASPSRGEKGNEAQ
jgi:hypothetical protein